MISIVICNTDAARLASIGAMYQAAVGAAAYELIPIHDARSLAEGYNRAIRQARGEIVVFSRDDIEILSTDFPRRLTRHMEKFDLLGVAGTDRVVGADWPAAGPGNLFGQIVRQIPISSISNTSGTNVASDPVDKGGVAQQESQLRVTIFGAPCRVVGHIQGLESPLLAARRSLLHRFAFDAINFDGCWFFDMDLAMQAHHAGLSVGVANDIQLLQHSTGARDAAWSVYAERFERKWRSRFSFARVREYLIATVAAESREDATAIMNPSYWTDGA